MIRELTIAAAFAGLAIALAPSAMADRNPLDPDGRYANDVPGMNYDAALTAPCDNTEVFTFGRGPGGEALACHYIGKQNSGYWQISYPLMGQQEIGSPCPGQRSAAQAPDGRPLVCLPGEGWQPGILTALPGPLYIPS
jgi:hypothetical protein